MLLFDIVCQPMHISTVYLYTLYVWWMQTSQWAFYLFCPQKINKPGQSEIIIASIAVLARRLSTTWDVTYKISAPRLGVGKLKTSNSACQQLVSAVEISWNIWRFPEIRAPPNHPICSLDSPWYTNHFGYPHDYGNPHDYVRIKVLVSDPGGLATFGAWPPGLAGTRPLDRSRGDPKK